MSVRRLSDGWTMSVDPENDGSARGWQDRPDSSARHAPVPGTMQQVVPDYTGVAWYWCEFESPDWSPSEQVLLTFEEVAYGATVWCNGTLLGSHEGDGAPFTFEITDQLQQGSRNLLAVRVVNPTSQAIDGYTRAEVPLSNAKALDTFTPGSVFNLGGIFGEVLVYVVPALRIADVFVRADLHHRLITVDAEIIGFNGASGPLRVAVTAREDRTGLVVAQAHAPLGSQSDSVRTQLRLEVVEPRLWDVDDPFLYLVHTRLEPADGGEAIHDVVVRTGFRELRVEDGFFHLNGRRIYLRSTHTGNIYPIGQFVPPAPSFVRQDLIYAKAAGFNTVRFIAGPSREDQLSFCDEIGLMVYEEATASWLLGDSPKMAERYDHGFNEMIARDRNHPSVVIWGLLNETYDGPVFRHAVDYLPTLRQLDDSRLVLLSSGRWDGDLGIGSIANPGESVWQHAWGEEEEGASRVEVNWQGDADRGGHVEKVGDIHLYPHLPETARAKQILRTMGVGTKPVFLSEYGVGSLFHAITERADAQRWVSDVVSPDVAYVRSMAERFEEDWARYGMDSMYCFPQDALDESWLQQSLNRAVTFDLIRSNGNIAGYNLTGMLDHTLTGEGSWSLWRRWKPGAMEAVSEGWSPLRWCLSVSPTVTYPGRRVTIELALANEDVLGAGTYAVDVAMLGPGGRRWQRSSTVEIGPVEQAAALAVPVLDEEVTLDGPPGEYRFAASMGAAASPAAGRATVQVIEPQGAISPRVRASVIGVDASTISWLGANGVDCVDDRGTLTQRDLIVIGHAERPRDELWSEVSHAVDRGATALLLAPGDLIASGEREATLPFGDGISVSAFHDWLYHKECFARDHALFENLQPPGLMRWGYYGDVLPRHLIHGDVEEVAAFAVAIGYPRPGGYVSGHVAAAFRQGSGRVVVNTFDLLGNLGSLAVADHLMLNLVRWSAGRRTQEG